VTGGGGGGGGRPTAGRTGLRRLLATALNARLDGKQLINNGSSAGDQEATRRLINDEITKRLEVQRQAGKDIDTKAAVVAAACLTGAQFLAGRSRMNGSLVFLSLVTLAVAGLHAYRCLRVREFDEVPEPQPFNRYYRDEDIVVVLTVLAATKAKAFETNRAIYRAKAGNVRKSFIWLAAAAALAAAAQFVGTHWEAVDVWTWLTNEVWRK